MSLGVIDSLIKLYRSVISTRSLILQVMSDVPVMVLLVDTSKCTKISR